MRAAELYENKLDTPEFHALLTDSVRRLGKLYKRNGFEIRIVGGAVRDLVLGKTPKDIDMATTALPEQSIQLLKTAGIRVEPTGLQHGTISAIIDKEPYEITTLRIDAETDGRHAKVSFTTDWKLDAERRDLTYNAMSLDFDGNLYDYFGGVDDLKSGVTRFVGNPNYRIQEDYLRILRYFRFAGRQPSPEWDTDTLRAIKANAHGLTRISGERIWAEMSKILSGSHTVEILINMEQTDVLSNIGLSNCNIREVSRLKSINVGDPRSIVAGLLRTIEDLTALNKRWKFDNQSFQLMAYLIQNRDKHQTWYNAIYSIYIEGKDKNLLRALFDYQDQSSLSLKLKSWQHPTLPINGSDLIALGIPPGKQLGEILKKARLAFLDSGFKDSKEDLLKKIIPNQST